VKKKPRAMSARQKERKAERAREQLATDRERLFALEPGGSAARPLEVASASVVEAHGSSVPCPRCDGAQEALEHAAVTVNGARLRELRLRCRQCGTQRSMFFRLRESLPN
jgi:hypothetical protein